MRSKKINDFIKGIFDILDIQFRKKDVRRSENIVLNINYDCLQKQKRVLLCYLDYNRAQYMLCHEKRHTNNSEMNQMIYVLSKMNYCIDVCACNNKDAIAELQSNRYDYIIGFGDVFKAALKKNPKAKSIIYMTENPFYISKSEEQKRIDYFFERTGKRCDFSRTGKFYQVDDEKMADVVLCLGEKKYYNGLQTKVVRIYPSAYKNIQYNQNCFKERKRENFLIFGVKGFVHKGCDLLIEVFSRHPEWTLYMCGSEIQQECQKYGYHLPANIIDCGFINVDSEKFLELVDKCCYTLLPSCSEGMSTSLLTCMMHGLIPITMRGTGMDELKESCFFFEGHTIEMIEEKLKEVCNLELCELQKLSDAIYDFANERFSIQTYTQKVQECFQECFEYVEEKNIEMYS